MPTSNKTSAESEILSALNANNPFERPPVVREQNIWGDSFPDIPAMNAKASDSLFDAMSQVRVAESSLEKITSLVFLSDRGSGKSHVIKRIRRRLQTSSEGIFIYASADRYGNLAMINSLFQQSIAESLDQQGSEGVTQWQEVAALLVANALKASNPNTQAPSALELVKKFDQLYHGHHKQGTDLVGKLARAIRRLKPDTDSYILRALVWTLSEERGPLAVKWLAGEQLGTQDAADLRLPPNQRSEGEADASALTTISKLISSISEYKTVVICFDELDSSAIDEDGRPAPYIILNLVKRLFDSLQQSERAKGVVILTAVLPNAWRQMKQNLQTSMERISAYGEPISLTNLNEDTAIDLCALTLGRFYEKKGLTASEPIYPFTEAEITSFGKGRPSPREALKWFATQLNEKLKTIDLQPISYTERFERAYQNALEQFEIDDLDNNDVTASALRFCFQKIAEIDKIKDHPIEGVTVKGVEDITPKSKNNGRLNFKIMGEENGKPVIIGIGVIQETHGLKVGTGFKRLLDTETFKLSRGCLVRSRDRKLKRYWDAFKYYQQLIAQGGEWVDLTPEEIYPLLALQYVYEHHEKFELTIKRLDSLGFTRRLLQSNQLIKEILSRPEGHVVEEATEGEELQRLSDEIDMNELEADLLKSLEEEDNAIKEAEVQFEMKELANAFSA
jgi:Cdc6-like AAA superfamily ATPase